MSAKLLDSELLEYWSRLNDEEKRLVLTAVKNYVDPGRSDEFPEELRKALVLEERNSYLRGKGLSYSWETVKKMAQGKPRSNGV